MTPAPANFDPSIDPTADQVRALRDAGPDGPVVMLNLLKFRDKRTTPQDLPIRPARVPRLTVGTRRHSWKRWVT